MTNKQIKFLRNMYNKKITDENFYTRSNLHEDVELRIFLEEFDRYFRADAIDGTRLVMLSNESIEIVEVILWSVTTLIAVVSLIMHFIAL